MREFDWGARRDRPQVTHDRVLTVANAITAVRLAGLPVFVWLLLGREAHGPALAVLAAVGATDWMDGYVARRFDQVTRIGTLLDPLVDRVLLATAGIALAIADVVPWWLVALLLVRDAAIVIGVLVLFRGVPPIRVTRVGKAATACLLVGLPGFLVARWLDAGLLLGAAWVFSLAGLAAYYIAGGQYARAALSTTRTRQRT